MFDKYDNGKNGEPRSLDTPLDPYVGATHLCLQVVAHGDSGSDAAVWLKPRIGLRDPVGR